jgi:hypothetical protein
LSGGTEVNLKVSDLRDDLKKINQQSWTLPTFRLIQRWADYGPWAGSRIWERLLWPAEGIIVFLIYTNFFLISFSSRVLTHFCTGS